MKKTTLRRSFPREDMSSTIQAISSISVESYPSGAQLRRITDLPVVDMVDVQGIALQCELATVPECMEKALQNHDYVELKRLIRKEHDLQHQYAHLSATYHTQVDEQARLARLQAAFASFESKRQERVERVKTITTRVIGQRMLETSRSAAREERSTRKDVSFLQDQIKHLGREYMRIDYSEPVTPQRTNDSEYVIPPETVESVISDLNAKTTICPSDEELLKSWEILEKATELK